MSFLPISFMIFIPVCIYMFQIDLQKALDEIRRIADMEVKRSEMFRQTLQDQEDKFLAELSQWEISYGALHRKYERNRRKRKSLARQLRTYTMFPVQKQCLICCHTGVAALRKEVNDQLKKINVEVGYLSRMMKILDSRTPCTSRYSSAIGDRKLSLVSELTDDAAWRTPRGP
eukprot:Gregarina_sp_Poly_1__7246@NODE_3989_length_791_cov_215_698895_g2588_i0_p1_GENE_NODE_3989_length_791_cov_215_698895_g2588_i0NODE_3989_length_791_cov_215_698895_g2588_i0_p1_ORF_typecomplete_len173_score28_46TACC_C/PF05010_14/0_00067GBP_C/PF02841_14/0_041PIN/PF01850_21/0_075CsgA/PF17334_2/0_11THOC7/PF05615_13/0_12MbeD_MobD/PF04899_12/0_72MbeD_MobD/PF04899_12/7_4e02CCCAP/PF15964_5/0_53_NODE_3989_length_791_cov_215_698895_g2588_i0170688